MEHPRKLEHENNDVQNLEGGASLDEAKGVGVVAPTMKNDGEKKGYRGQNQPTFEVSAEMQQLQDDFEIEAICAAFNRLQLRELERIFQRTQFPNVFGLGRKELETPVNAEAKGKPCEPEEESV